ncbi:hypothetical protein [Paenibacillus phoenicis]|uniref:hypothetical protein n=1 Tax=Paenibacillus phoenicis TaxID=554117 RepID=UPI003D2CE74E
MGHSVRTMMDISFACLVFVMAATAGLLLFQNGAAALNAAVVSERMQDRNVQQTFFPIAGDGSVSGAEVLQSLVQIGDIGVEIVVNGVEYATTMERDDISASSIRLDSRYESSYERGPDGQLRRIAYVLRGEG